MDLIFKNHLKPKIAVLGDIMIDINIMGNVDKLANESPIPVLLYTNKKSILGGCGNVVNNLKSIGCDELYVLTVIGNDDNGAIIKNLLSNINVKNNPIIDIDRRSTSKNRFFSNQCLMFRYDIEDTNIINKLIQDILYEEFIRITEIGLDCIIFSDYNKGVCCNDLCIKIINKCNELGIKTVVDPKNNFYKYQNVTLIKPNRNEASYFLKKKILMSTIEYDLKYIKEQLNTKYSVITLADKGIYFYDGIKYFSSKTDKIDVIDVTGAGDIVCSLLAYLICISNDFQLICKITNFLATLSVHHIGTYVLQECDFAEFYFKNNIQNKIIDFYQLSIISKISKKIIFTNGCFDLIHLGHINCLKYCKSLGDILVVAINSDISVKKLKGEKRPIQNQEKRSSIISSFEYVDYVLIFDEDTPLNIIKELRPSIIVKGGDYKKEDVIGKEYADDVVIFKLLEDISTTNTIKKINDN